MEHSWTCYKTVRKRSCVESIVNKSRFIAIAFPTFTADEAQAGVDAIRREYADCSSMCYGYVCGFSGQTQKFFDDHEPVGGMPILDAIRKRGLTGCACAVVRYFGGVKLGMGGLARAFGSAAIDAVEAAEPGTAQKSLRMEICTGYEFHGKLDYYLTHSPYILEDTQFTDQVSLQVLLPWEDKDAFSAAVQDLCAGSARIRIAEETFAFWE